MKIIKTTLHENEASTLIIHECPPLSVFPPLLQVTGRLSTCRNSSSMTISQQDLLTDKKFCQSRPLLQPITMLYEIYQGCSTWTIMMFLEIDVSFLNFVRCCFCAVRGLLHQSSFSQSYTSHMYIDSIASLAIPSLCTLPVQ